MIRKYQKWNNNKCRCECTKHHICEKGDIWNPGSCSCENGNNLASFIDDPAITCDEIIDEIKTVSKSFNGKNIICETKNFYILLTLLLITTALLTDVSIYFCLIKYEAKQKHLLPYYVTNDKLQKGFMLMNVF